MNIIEDAINVNFEAIKKTFNKLAFVPILVVLLILMSITEDLILTLLSPSIGSVSFLLGFVRYAVSVLFMSAIVSILSDIVLYDRFKIENLFSGYQRYFHQVSSAYFYFVVLEWLLFFIDLPISIAVILRYLILVMLSPFYETMYIADEYGADVFTSIFGFLKNNILPWTPTLVIYVVVKSNYDNLVGVTSVVNVLGEPELWIKVIISAIVLAFILIFKGNLFKILNGSSVRKRMFQGKF